MKLLSSISKERSIIVCVRSFYYKNSVQFLVAEKASRQRARWQAKIVSQQKLEIKKKNDIVSILGHASLVKSVTMIDQLFLSSLFSQVWTSPPFGWRKHWNFRNPSVAIANKDDARSKTKHYECDVGGEVVLWVARGETCMPFTHNDHIAEISVLFFENAWMPFPGNDQIARCSALFEKARMPLPDNDQIAHYAAPFEKARMSFPHNDQIARCSTLFEKAKHPKVERQGAYSTIRAKTVEGACSRNGLRVPLSNKDWPRSYKRRSWTKRRE